VYVCRLVRHVPGEGSERVWRVETPKHTFPDSNYAAFYISLRISLTHATRQMLFSAVLVRL